MEAAFYYIVRVKLIRHMQGEEINFISDEKEFKDISPLRARDRAFQFYNSYIETLLEPELSHNEVQTLLAPRIHGADLGDKLILDPEKTNEIYIPPSIFNGIGVFLKVKSPIGDDKEGAEYFIHGVGFWSDYLQLIDSLSFEMDYYKYYGYKTDDKEISVDFYDYEEVCTEVVLKTPFDWAGMDMPQEQEEDEEEKNEEKESKYGGELRFGGEIKSPLLHTKILVRLGEGRTIEFKPSLISYEKEEKVYYGKYNKFQIVKTIAAFLNSSSGGYLLVGVSDKKEVLGLKNDFTLAGDKSHNPRDFFNIQVDYIIKDNFKSVASNITGRFVQIEGKEVYLFEVRPSAKPIFVLNDTKSSSNPQKEFYVRTAGASSIHYYDIEDIVGYCLNHWGKPHS